MELPIVLHVDPKCPDATLSFTIVVRVRNEAEAASPGGQPELLKIKEACALAGVGRTTADAYIRCGAWPSVRIGDRGIRIRRADLMNWIANLPSASLR